MRLEINKYVKLKKETTLGTEMFQEIVKKQDGNLIYLKKYRKPFTLVGNKLIRDNITLTIR
jgi:hypothetical protein